MGMVISDALKLSPASGLRMRPWPEQQHIPNLLSTESGLGGHMIPSWSNETWVSAVVAELICGTHRTTFHLHEEELPESKTPRTRESPLDTSAPKCSRA